MLQIFSANNFAERVLLTVVLSPSGVVVPLVGGTCTAFLAQSSLSDALAADPNLVGTVVETATPGTYLIAFGAAVLAPAIMRAKFAKSPCYLIVIEAGGIRGALELEWLDERLMTLVA